MKIAKQPHMLDLIKRETIYNAYRLSINTWSEDMKPWDSVQKRSMIKQIYLFKRIIHF